MNKDDVIKFIDGKVYYYSDYIIFLYKQLELKDNIIKEVREELLKYENDMEANRYAPIRECLELLDKGE